MHIILYRFHTTLPPLFHKLNDKSDENDEPAKKGKPKGASNGNKEEQRNSQKKSSKITNTDQVEEFKMAEGETWEGTFQGKCHEKRVKWLGSFMCPRYHTKGEDGRYHDPSNLQIGSQVGT